MKGKRTNKKNWLDINNSEKKIVITIFFYILAITIIVIIGDSTIIPKENSNGFVTISQNPASPNPASLTIINKIITLQPHTNVLMKFHPNIAYRSISISYNSSNITNSELLLYGINPFPSIFLANTLNIKTLSKTFSFEDYVNLFKIRVVNNGNTTAHINVKVIYYPSYVVK